MAKRKGMSLEEKRTVVMHFLWETKSVFNMKELEKEASKRGVVAQTVEEVVKSLVDDRLVECEKIGSGNFYWSFPSKAYVTAKSRLDAHQAAAAADRTAAAALEARLKELAAGRESTADRAGKLTELEALKAEREALAAQLKAYADSDPDAYKALLAKVGGAKAGADRWTDNVFTAKSYLINKFGKEPREVDAMLGLKDDFDYVK